MQKNNELKSLILKKDLKGAIALLDALPPRYMHETLLFSGFVMVRYKSKQDIFNQVQRQLLISCKLGKLPEELRLFPV